MFNILLDALPTEYEGFPIDSDFQIGIQIMQVLEDDRLTQQERIGTALSLLFITEDEAGNPLPVPDFQTAIDGLKWFLFDWNHDHNSDKSDEAKVTDYDIDQWRIYSAFQYRYGINLNDLGTQCIGYKIIKKEQEKQEEYEIVPIYKEKSMHFWEFMGLLTTLPPECAYRQVIDIRCKKITPKMSAEEKNALKEAKKIYALDALEEELTDSEKEAVEAFMALIGKDKK